MFSFQWKYSKYSETGHFSEMGRTKNNFKSKRKNIVNILEESSNSDDEVYISSIGADESENRNEK